MTRKNVIDQQTGYSSIAILEGMDADIAIMEQDGQVHRMHLTYTILLIVPSDKICH